MAPRAPDSLEFIARQLRGAAKRPGAQVAFVGRGHSHTSHVACEEGGVWRVRTWVLDAAKARAYLEKHGHFMPEDAEAISEPGSTVVLEAKDVEALVVSLGKSGLV